MGFVTSTRVERRLAAILSADMVGYSRLMEVDEAGTIARHAIHRSELIDPKIATYNGRIVKTTGDGMLVEFASAVDAVGNAIAVQEGLAQHANIKLRIGIHIGDIVHEDEDIYGDGVNVAARLQEIAEPGGVALSGRARDFLDSKLANVFRDAGEKQLKNIADAVRVFVSGDDEPDQTPSVEAALPLPDKPSIAVLPFDNVSGDPEQDYFSTGLTEDLITRLSRYPFFYVIARGSSSQYGGGDVDEATVLALMLSWPPETEKVGAGPTKVLFQWPPRAAPSKESDSMTLVTGCAAPMPHVPKTQAPEEQTSVVLGLPSSHSELCEH